VQDLTGLLEASRLRHSHLCPRQVLGVRMAIAGPEAIGLPVPRADKALLVIAETDGCFLDGLQAVTGASPTHRTLRIEDYGKIAATFANVNTGEAVRVAPKLDVRARAAAFAPPGSGRYRAQLIGYQAMPDEELLSLTHVCLAPSLLHIISRAGARTNCATCGEEIINEREVVIDEVAYCHSCVGNAYYRAEQVGFELANDCEQEPAPQASRWPS
jgi:formylmethanofuran dehydrogenase subunit E